MSGIDFRKEIKKRMKNHKISTPELARRIELNSQTLYNFLSGKSELTSANLSAALDVLGVKKLI